MALSSGQIYGAGMRILLKSSTEALDVTDGPVAFLHLVDSDDNTLVPEYVPQGLQTPGGPLSGAKYTIVSSAQLAALVARVEALEAIAARMELTSTGLKLKNNEAQTVIEVGSDVGSPTIRFFGGTPQMQQGVVLSSPTLDEDTANAIATYNLITVTP